MPTIERIPDEYRFTTAQRAVDALFPDREIVELTSWTDSCGLIRLDDGKVLYATTLRRGVLVAETYSNPRKTYMVEFKED